MTQRSFAGLEYVAKKRKTRREQFLERTDALIPWTLIHSVHTTATNEANVSVGGELLHGAEGRAWGDAGWWIAMRPSQRKALERRSAKVRFERFKSQTRAKLEHPFRYLKRVFGYGEVRYCGLAKNTNRPLVLSRFMICIGNLGPLQR